MTDLAVLARSAAMIPGADPVPGPAYLVTEEHVFSLTSAAVLRPMNVQSARTGTSSRTLLTGVIR